jgi:ABC-type transport system involved in multi-copper enzyme maturation permease subunit
VLLTFIRKELLSNVKSLRFTLTFFLVISVFIVSGLIFVSKHNMEMAEYWDATNKNLAKLEEYSQNLSLLPYYVQNIRKRHKVNQVVCEGFEKSLPSTFKFDVFSFDYPEIESRSNFLFPRFADIDWTFIIAFILSFTAFLMTFDSISAEKERGTLGLTLANSVPKDQILLGKYISGLLILLIPVAVGLLLNILIVDISGISVLRREFIWKFMAFVILSILYLSVFVLLGVLVSSLTLRSSLSITLLLFVWVIVAIIIPALGRIGAQQMISVPSRSEVEQRIENSRRQIWSEIDRFGKNAGNWGIDVEINYQGRSRLFNAITEAKNQIKQDYMNRSLAQIEAGRKIMRFSPTPLFQFASESIFNTGIARFRNLYRQLRRYQSTFRDFILDNDREDPDSMHYLAENSIHHIMLSQKPVDFNVIPKFEEREISITEGLKSTTMDIGILAVWNILIGIAAYFAFLKADVRQQ